MKNNLKLILGIIGGVVVVGSIAVAMIHFWDDLKKLLPCFGKCDEGLDDFDERSKNGAAGEAHSERKCASVIFA